MLRAVAAGLHLRHQERADWTLAVSGLQHRRTGEWLRIPVHHHPTDRSVVSLASRRLIFQQVRAEPSSRNLVRCRAHLTLLERRHALTGEVRYQARTSRNRLRVQGRVLLDGLALRFSAVSEAARAEDPLKSPMR